MKDTACTVRPGEDIVMAADTTEVGHWMFQSRNRTQSVGPDEKVWRVGMDADGAGGRRVPLRRKGSEERCTDGKAARPVVVAGREIDQRTAVPIKSPRSCHRPTQRNRSHIHETAPATLSPHHSAGQRSHPAAQVRETAAKWLHPQDTNPRDRWPPCAHGGAHQLALP